MFDHRSTSSKTLIRSKNFVTGDESSSSEGASEGGTDKNGGYNADKELPMSDREGII